MRLCRRSQTASRRGLLLVAAVLITQSSAAVVGQDIDLEIDAAEDPFEVTEDDPKVVFYLPLDGDTVGRTPDHRIRSLTRDYDQDLEMEFGEGIVGKACVVYGSHYLTYPTDDVLDRQKGTLSFWFKCKPEAKLPDGSTMIDGALAVPGQGALNRGDGGWHHWVVTWNVEKRKKIVFLDGEELASSAMKEPVGGRIFRLGRQCPGLLDEVCIFDLPLTDEAVADAFERTKKGRKPWPEADRLRPGDDRYPVSMDASKQKRPRRSSSVDWDLKPEGETQSRTRYCLDGYWRAQPFGTKMTMPTLGQEGKLRRRAASLAPQEGAWAYTRVPGSWRTHGNLNRLGGILSPQGFTQLSTWNDVDVSFYPCAWLERDFELRETRPEAGVFLVVDGVHDAFGCDLYVNDQFVGSIVEWQQREFNVSKAVKLNGANRIDIMAGKPYGNYNYKDRYGETVWLPSGMCLPVHLEVRDEAKVSFRDIIPMPSFRKKRLDVEFWVDNPGGRPKTKDQRPETEDGKTKGEERGQKREFSAEAHITDTRTGKAIQLARVMFTTGEEAEEMHVLSFPWEDPILWFPDDPNLLKLSLVIREGDRLVDETYPVRFGFREVWAEDGDFWMNGVRFWMHGQCHSVHADSVEAVYDRIDRLGLVGMRSSIAYFMGRSSMPPKATEATINAADEKGFLFNFKVYGGGLTGEGYRRSLRDYFKQFRAHPCAVCFNRCVYGYHGPAHGSPISMGRDVEEKEKELPEYRENQNFVDLCHEVNPGCLVAYYQQGVVGDYRSYMQYLGYGTPPQTREEWPRYWAENRPAPFLGAELDMNLSLFQWKWQNGYNSGKQPFEQGAEPHTTEHGARYFGDEAYAKETADYVRAINAHTDKEEAYNIYDAPNSVDSLALVVKHTTRAWRTYGISYLIHDETKLTYRTDLTLNKVDRAYRDGHAWFLAYIGGLKGDFVRKDHAFFSGEPIDKQVIMINSRFHPVDAKIECRLVPRGGGEEVDTFTKEVKVEAGDILKLPFALPAPEVKAKTQYVLRLQVQEEGNTWCDDFDVEVFPRTGMPDTGQARILVLDKTGDTSAVLKKAGISFSAVELADVPAKAAGAELLVIGRQGLSEELEAQRELFRAAQKGLNILCFEQMTREVLGLNNDDPNTRHAFVSAPDHPVVSGLSDEDFRNWRGASDILEPYPDYREGIKYGLLEHKSARGFFGQCEFAQWSSNGTVATFHLEKPQIGSFRTILSSGFDMLYSPLVELQVGRGRALLCQLDVTNRYGTDPVATLVVNRMLEELTRKDRGSREPVAWWGSPYWGKALDLLRAESRQLESLKDLSGVRIAVLGIDTFPVRIPVKKKTDAMKAESEAKGSSDVKLITPKAGEAVDGEGDDDEAVEELLKEEAEGKPGRAGPSLPTAVKERIRELEAGREVVSAFLARGGTLVVPYVRSARHVKWLPFDVGVEEREVFNARARGIRELSGSTAADFFFREVLKMPVIASLPDGSVLQETGFVGVVRHGKGRVVFCQLYPEYFQNSWQRTKILRLWSVLLGNLGVRFREVEPEEGEQNLSDAYYACPALDFNPDKHRSW